MSTNEDRTRRDEQAITDTESARQYIAQVTRTEPDAQAVSSGARQFAKLYNADELRLMIAQATQAIELLAAGPDVPAEESRMVEVVILDHGNATLDAMQARNAAMIVLGPNRALRVHDDGLGWWVELTAQETAVLDAQGFIELEKAGYTIRSCE